MSTLRARGLAAASALALGLGGALVVAAPAAAVTPVVTSTADDGGGTETTLREAIEAIAAGGAGADNVVTFDLPGAGPWTISLLSSLPDIQYTTSIEGPGADLLTIEAPFGNDTFAFVPNEADADFALSDVTLAGNNPSRGLWVGVGAESPRSVTLTDVVFEGFSGGQTGMAADLRGITASVSLSGVTAHQNESTASGGAAVHVQESPTAVMTVTDSVFSDNTAAVNGGAMIVSGVASLQVTDTSFTGNRTTASGGGLAVLNVPGHVTLTRVTASGNETGASGGGGAVYVENSNDFTIEGGTYEQNEATAGDGGAVRVVALTGTMSVKDSAQFSDNTADHSGGAIAVVDSGSLDVQVLDAVFTDNHAAGTSRNGGAIWCSGTRTITVERSLFEGNDASQTGGALYTTSGFTTLLVQQSSFVENAALEGFGGAVGIEAIEASGGSATFRWSSFASNSSAGVSAIGGAIVAGTVADGNVLSVDSSTFIDNEVDGGEFAEGAAIGLVASPNGGRLDVVNSTFSELAPVGEPYAIYVGGTAVTGLVTVRNTTLTAFGGILLDTNAGGVQIVNSIVETTLPGAALDSAVNLIDSQYSLYSSAFDAATFVSAATNRFGLSAMRLGALADNGGPTLPTGVLLTRLPAENSPAVNAGNASVEVDLPATDQRGPGFARVLDAALDIGAIERPVPPLPATGQTVPTWVVGGGLVLLVLGGAAVAGAAMLRGRTR